MSETPKTQAGQTGLAPKTKKTVSKKSSSKNGLSVKENLAQLNSSISIAKGLLATLSLGHRSDWTNKLEKMDPEHLRILLQDVMDEIWNADLSLRNLESKLKKKYMGICLL
jgi:hypothetical protein